MAMARIGTLSLLNNTLRDVGMNQAKLGELQTQISGGYKSQDFAGLNGSVEQFTQVTAQIDRATQFVTNNQMNISKLQTADKSISNIYDLADKMKTTIIGATGANIAQANVPQIMEDLLSSVAAELNTTYGGSYIFGGTHTTDLPMPDTNIPNTVSGVPDANYYNGSTYNTVMRADERTDIEFPLRADNIAFQKIYAAAKLAISAANDGDTTRMGEAQQLIQSGITDLTTARSKVGSTLDHIRTVNDRLTSLKTYWTELTDKVSKTDLVAASTEVASYQSLLQASFQVYARLSQLRLSDYLK